jgi:tetratricopeptide (TPR) repeat protein
VPKLLLLLAALFLLPVGGGDNPFLEKYLSSARRHVERGELDEARAAVERALERDDQHLGALRLLAEIAEQTGDTDGAVYNYHRWLSVIEAAEKLPVPKSRVREIEEHLALLDATSEVFRDLSTGHVDKLLALAKEHRKKGREHSAIEIYQEVLQVDRLNQAARDGILDIQRNGSADVAVEDLYAGTDPTAGVDPEWIAEQDKKHDTWDTAWEKDGENYRYKTDAGYLVLQTASIAMEQMNQAYRKFFQYKLDGDPTPKIDVLIYKNRDEYLEENNLPENDWTGGFFNGGSVQTFLGGASGKETIREMYGTLFHEAAHQFVSLTGKGGVPGWLNEAYASFFEGTTILSNGTVKWNQVPNHRLFPLAARMDQGWMSSGSEARPDEQGNWNSPDTAPTFRIVVEGQYRWGPPWYAPTWGVVYFLYNFRDEETGLPVFRQALHEYYLSGAAGRGDPVAHFEETVLSKKAAPLSPVRDIDALNELWREWILDLREVQRGKATAGKSNLEYGDLAMGRGDLELALEFYEEAYTHMPEDPEVVWKLAGALEEHEDFDRALALYLAFARELELRGITDEERAPVAAEKIRKLDPLYRRHEKLKQDLLAEGLELARSYRERGLPSMSLEIARRMSANFSLPEALEFYVDVARETGISLARWKVAYNEFDLEGWSGAEDYRAYGKMIEAVVVPDANIATAEGQFQTRELSCDVTFDADFSLEAEMQFGRDATLMGLCFGRKDGTNFNAVVLHPAGYLDISSQAGGVWTVRDHRTVALDSSWAKLRIDVVDDELDVYLNGQYVRSMQMPSRDSVRGGFGLICGTGAANFQNIRLLARDPHDPAARIERELAMERLANQEVQRAPGSFSGIEPPALELGEVVQGEFPTLEELKGRPAALIFWAPYQDEVIPTTDYYAHLAEEYGPLGLRFVAVVSSQHSAEQVRAYLAAHPMSGVPVAMDVASKTYNAYNLRAEGFGLPRILVLDSDGTVAWEGDPGFKIGLGWDPLAGETFLDGPLKDLVERRFLRELKELAGTVEAAEAMLAEGRIQGAIEALRPLLAIDAPQEPLVRAGRALQARIEAAGAALPVQADEALEQGYPIRALVLLRGCAEQYLGTPTGDLAGERLRRLDRDRGVRDAERAWKFFERAVADAEAGRDAERIRGNLDKARAASSVREVLEMADALEAALAGTGAAAVPAVWQERQPVCVIEP